MPGDAEYQGGRLPLKSRNVFETDDLLAARDHLSGYLGRHTINPLEKKYRVRFRHSTVDIGRVSISALHYGTAIRIGVRPQKDMFLLLILLHGNGMVKQQGYKTAIGPRAVYAFNPEVSAVLELSREQYNFTIKVPGSIFREFLEQESGRSLLSNLEFRTYIPDTDISGDSLRGYIKFLCDEIDAGNQHIELPIMEKQHEQTILGLALADLAHNHSEFMGMDALEPAPEYIRRVEIFIANNFSEVINLSDLAECAAISTRALQNGFRRFRNTTPMEYLRDYRLNISRQRLGDDKFTGMNISKIASDCGFSHLSKFAKCYRQRFDETPSETRKRKRIKII